MGPSAALSHLSLKFLASVIRSVVVLKKAYRRIVLRTTVDWERALTQVSKVDTITSRTGMAIKIRVWEPPKEFTGLRPVHITFHGSGYIIPSLGTDSDFCQFLSERLGITVLDCDYSKAPEYPFPYAYNEVIDVIKYVLTQPGKYDLNNLTIGGFSAGGGLTACVAANEEFAWDAVKALVLIYPPGDWSNPPGLPPKAPPGSTASVLHPTVIDAFCRCYIRGESSLADPKISPLLADWTHYTGKAHITVGEYDNLKDGGIALGEKMKQDGVNARSVVIKDVGHGWDKTARKGTWEHERKSQAYESIALFLEEVYNAPKLESVVP